MKIAIIGATGMVGHIMLKVLSERKFPVTKLILVASEKSIGKKITFEGNNYSVIGLDTALKERPNFALFSAGSETSLEWAPKFAALGTTVIDNSSAWRMDPNKKLIVPEINGNILTADDKIIANPNCSTIQMVMALAPLHKAYSINRLVISTYQSITGTGVKALEQLNNESLGKNGEMVYPYPIHQNALPQCDSFLENDYTKEEMKLMHETHKIFSDDTIGITATAVRIPVIGGHSESINIQFEKDFEIADIRSLLHKTPGIIVKDNPTTNIYPMPIYAEGKDEVFVGRIRKDTSHPKALNIWVVADNLRKGAATNTVQIAEYLISNNF